MAEDEVFSAVAKIIAETCPVDAAGLTPETRLEAINVESLDLVEIVFKIEDRFGIEVPQNVDADSRLEFATIGQIVDGVKRVLANPKPT